MKDASGIYLSLPQSRSPARYRRHFVVHSILLLAEQISMVATIDESRMTRDERVGSADAIHDAKSTMLEKRRKLRVAIVTGESISARLQ